MPSETEVNNAQGELDRLRAEADRVARQVEGGNWDTEGDIVQTVLGFARHEIVGDSLFKVEGGYQKIQLGISHSLNAIFKGKFVLGARIIVAAPIESKIVIGKAYTSITGAKKETVGGAKIDTLCGVKFEKKATHSATIGSAPEKRSEGRKMSKAERFAESVGSVVAKCSSEYRKTTKLHQTIGSLKEDIQSLERKVAWLERNVDVMTQDAGHAVLDCSEYSESVSTAEIQGAPIFLGGGDEATKLVGCYCLKAQGAYFQAAGSTVLVNGTMIRAK